MASRTEVELPPGLADLKNFDALLRCPICFDFFNNAMMTKCSHNFCSLCIRKFFSNKLQCPICNKQASEEDLRNIRLLDELVVNFQDVRQKSSKANFDSPPASPRTPVAAVKCKTLRERDQKSPKTSPAEETRWDGSVSPCAERRKTLTARTHGAGGGDRHSATAQLPAAVKEEPRNEEEEKVSAQGLMSVKREEAPAHAVSTRLEKTHSSSSSKDVNSLIKVKCPVCSVGVSQQNINKHLDTCLTSREKKESLRTLQRSHGKTRRPMGKLVYELFSVQELKRRLKECHLSTLGSRDQLIKRHQEFVQAYNAQCDSLNPKSAEEIAKEVEGNEKLQNQPQGKAKPVMVFTKNQTEKKIDDMRSNYRKQHSSDVSHLITQVRARPETTRPSRIKKKVSAEGGNVKKTPSADCAAVPGRRLRRKAADGDGDAEPSERAMELSSSPSHSDISVSSSLSDIFDPEPAANLEDTDRTSTQKRTSSSRGNNAALPPVPGRRLRRKI